MNKLRVGIIGATGYVGQRFLTILADHPWFEVTRLFASPKSAGQTYSQAVKGRWKLLEDALPCQYANIVVESTSDINSLKDTVDLVFCAVNMDKIELIELENSIAKLEIPVVSNNSAQRLIDDVPMIIPEVNPEHLDIIPYQQQRLGVKHGFVACKPNCSIQAYVIALTALEKFQVDKVFVNTYQAVSGAGRNLKDWPEINANVIPYIGGEEAKSEIEPLKIWGKIKNGIIKSGTGPVISAQCYRVPVEDGHLAAVNVAFKEKVTAEAILTAFEAFEGKIKDLNLPSAPTKPLTYFNEPDRPQSKVDANLYNGMGISIGRLRQDPIFDYKFTCLAHNSLRGAAKGAVLLAELLVAKGYIG